MGQRGFAAKALATQPRALLTASNPSLDRKPTSIRHCAGTLGPSYVVLVLHAIYFPTDDGGSLRT